jgi:hypothetical protein
MHHPSMQRDFQQIDFESVGIEPSEIEKITILRNRGTHLVCRVKCNQESYVLKWFNSPVGNKETQVYELLQNYGVETLQVYKRTENALLLEDLQYSAEWRLANDSDMGQAETGQAIANWYRVLHQAGRELLSDISQTHEILHPWVESIDEDSLLRAGNVFALQNAPGWGPVVASIERLKNKYLGYPQTFNYNDFAAENLAISCGPKDPLRVIVFDYDCFSTGVVFSDWRNVVYALDGDCKAEFKQTYGPISEDERLLDEPLAILYGLVIASQREKTPKWALPLIEAVKKGELADSINVAMEL